jgi:hypothetical protein
LSRFGVNNGATMFDDDALLPDPLVAKRYNVSTRTIPRWDANLALGFPAPTFINGRKYRRVRELEAWERYRAAHPMRGAAPRRK